MTEPKFLETGQRHERAVHLEAWQIGRFYVRMFLLMAEMARQQRLIHRN